MAKTKKSKSRDFEPLTLELSFIPEGIFIACADDPRAISVARWVADVLERGNA